MPGVFPGGLVIFNPLIGELAEGDALGLRRALLGDGPGLVVLSLLDGVTARLVVLAGFLGQISGLPQRHLGVAAEPHVPGNELAIGTLLLEPEDPAFVAALAHPQVEAGAVGVHVSSG